MCFTVTRRSAPETIDRGPSPSSLPPPPTPPPHTHTRTRRRYLAMPAQGRSPSPSSPRTRRDSRLPTPAYPTGRTRCPQWPPSRPPAPPIHRDLSRHADAIPVL
ncbi:ATPase 4 plasma membrane-type [Zea mays]|uniref:ATPase 4 plasma membrane-type n=1 Tax=Zea mays TaxID=4577 RepID=A0A1D6I7U5_MAIZE|nr:ATPase 4 plasma membrane-type [Zea mays]